MQFSTVFAIPRLDPLVDPAATVGDAHDGAWVISASLDRSQMGCILDGTVRVPASQVSRLDTLAAQLPSVPTIAVALRTPDGTPPLLDLWMTRWPDPQDNANGYPSTEIVHVDDPSDPDALTRLVSHDLLHDAKSIVIVLAHGGTLVTPASLAALHSRLPELRPILLATEPLSDELIEPLAAMAGAHVLITGPAHQPSRTEVTWHDVEIDLLPHHDVELAVHAERVEREGPRVRVRRPQALRATDDLRVDAIAMRAGQPAFTVALRARRTDLPLECTAFAIAHPLQATPPEPLHVERAVEANRIVVPQLEPLATTLPKDLWVDGAITFELAGEITRIRLLPSARISTPTMSIDLRVLRGAVYVQARSGDVLYDGVRLVGERKLEPYRTLTLDDVRASFVIAAAWPDEHPEVVIEGGIERYLSLLTIDGVAVELRRHARSDELWCNGIPLALHGTVCRASGDLPVDAADLSWLLLAARQQSIAGTSSVPLIFAEQHGLSARLTIDRDAARATYVVFET